MLSYKSISFIILVCTGHHSEYTKKKVAPHWHPDGEQSDVKELRKHVGEVVTLECWARGHPRPVITWLKDEMSEPLTDSRGVSCSSCSWPCKIL